MLLLGIAVAPAWGQSPPLFDAPATSLAHDAAHGLAVGDFNGDGKPDVTVLADNLPSGLASHLNLLGNGMGAFTLHASNLDGTAANYAIDDVNGLAVADFNGDGKLDVASARPVTNQITLMLGLGGGTFLTPVVIGTSASDPSCLVAADFNGDGRQDLATGNLGTNKVNLLMNQGLGVFLPGASIAVDTAPGDLAVGDVNGDGRPDLVATSFNHLVSVLLGHGDGSFDPPLFSGSGAAQPLGLVLADFNQDGDLDLATANPGGSVTTAEGAGDGTFATTATLSAGTSCNAVVAGDVDGDGLKDLVAVGSSGTASVFIGRGDGSFGPPGKFTSGFGVQSPGQLAAADVNGDGRLDIVSVTNTNGSAVLSVALGEWNFGSFAANGAVTDPGDPIVAVAADFDGDGRADLAAAESATNAVGIFAAGAGGSFSSLGTHTVGSSPIAMATSDFNGDGRPDLVTANAGSNNLSVLLGLGGGNFSNAANFPVDSSPRDVQVADLNLDGDQDLATADDPTQQVAVLLGQGDGTFLASGLFPTVGSPVSLAVADFNDDGKPDAVPVSSLAATIALLLGQGNGNFTIGGSLAVGPGLPLGSAAGDFDLDGTPDLALVFTDQVKIELATGGLFIFTGHGSWAVDTGARSVAAGDVDGDGKLDLVTANGAGGTLTVLRGVGAGNFTSAGSFEAGPGLPASVTLADFDGDGRRDLATPQGLTGAWTNRIGILLGHGAPVGTWTHLGSALAGVSGPPLLEGSGPLTGGSPGQLALSFAKSFAPSALFVSVSSSPIPFKGGTLVPMPFAMQAPFVTATGGLTLPFTWPTGIPPGVSFWFQDAISDAAAIKGVALSNAVKATTP